MAKREMEKRELKEETGAYKETVSPQKPFKPGEVEKAITNRDPDHGGVAAFLVGKPGNGKTNALCQIAYLAAEQGDTVLWRGKYTCQWTRLIGLGYDVVLWLHEDIEYNTKSGETGDLIDYGERVTDVRRFSTGEELVEELERGEINVVQGPPSKHTEKSVLKFFAMNWIEIFQALQERPGFLNDPVTVCFDEMEDLAPQNVSGFHEPMQQLAAYVKEFRKMMVHLYAALHNFNEMDWRPRNKFLWTLYFKGADVPHETGIDQSVVNELRPHQFIIHGTYWEPAKFNWIGDNLPMVASVKVSDSSAVGEGTEEVADRLGVDMEDLDLGEEGEAQSFSDEKEVAKEGASGAEASPEVESIEEAKDEILSYFGGREALVGEVSDRAPLDVVEEVEDEVGLEGVDMVMRSHVQTWLAGLTN